MRARFYVVALTAGLAAGLASALALIGCTKTSEKYCGLHPEDAENCGDGSGSPTCDIDGDCAATAATGVCEVGDGVCVQCLPEAGRDIACAGTTPICDGTSCRGCSADTECATNVCVAGGRCAAADEVAYVAVAGSGSDCTQSAPCGELREAERTERTFIKITGDVMVNDKASFLTGDRVIHGDGARLTVIGGTTMIEIGDPGTSLEIRDLEMTTTAGSEKPVINVLRPGATLTLDNVVIHDASGNAVESTVDTLVTIRRSIIARNASTSPALNLENGQYHITNTIIVGNGTGTAAVGAARLAPTGAIAVFSFNTVADNDGAIPSGIRTAVSCEMSTVDNSIVSGGRIGLDCDPSYTLYDVGVAAAPTNMNGSPTFQNETMVTAATYYRLTPASLGVNSADMNATLIDDIDGQPRPVGTSRDMGADEVQ